MNIENTSQALLAERKTLLSVLSRSSAEDIEQRWNNLDLQPQFTLLKPPEIGMVMVKARTGGNGSAFNMGEMTVTRTVLQLASNELGYGYTAGRDKEKSLHIALIDACYQCDAWRDRIHTDLLQPLSEQLQVVEQQHTEQVDRTKVNFFTMVRGE